MLKKQTATDKEKLKKNCLSYKLKSKKHSFRFVKKVGSYHNYQYNKTLANLPSERECDNIKSI